MKIPRALWLIIACVLLVHISFLHSAAVFDEPGYLEGVYRTFTHHLNPFISWEGYKPPVTVWMPAFFSLFWGPSRELARLWIILLSGACVFVLYRLAERVSTRKTAMLAALLWSVFPVFFIQGFIVSDAIPLTVGMLLLWYFLVTENVLGFMIAGIWILLTKETAIIAYAASAVLFVGYGNPKYRLLRVVSALMPLVPFATWLLLNKHLLGWYVWPGSAVKITTMIVPTALSVRSFFWDMQGVWFNPYTFVLTLLAGYEIYRGKFRVPLVRMWIILCVVYVYLYSNIGLEIRYVLFLYPFLIMLASAAIVRISEHRPRIGLLALTMVILTCMGWQVWATVDQNRVHPEASISLFAYRDMTEHMIAFVDQHYPSAVIVSSWPNLAVWQNDPFVATKRNHAVILCPTKTADDHRFWHRYDSRKEYIFIESSRIHLFACDFRTLRLVPVTEIRNTRIPWFSDTIRIFRILPSE